MKDEYVMGIDNGTVTKAAIYDRKGLGCSPSPQIHADADTREFHTERSIDELWSRECRSD